MTKEQAQKEIQEKLSQLHKLIGECEAIKKEHGIDFTIFASPSSMPPPDGCDDEDDEEEDQWEIWSQYER